MQPRPGIGDLIWHLPLIHALAGDGQVDLMTKRSTAADVLLADDPAIRRIIWLDRNPPGRRGRHDGPFGFARLAGDLRAVRAGAAVLLHQSVSLAAALAVAGITKRLGYGYGRQRMFLNAGPTLPASNAPQHPTVQAQAFATAVGLGVLADTVQLAVSPEAAAAVRAREGPLERWAVLGVGSTESNRCWPTSRFAALAGLLLEHGAAGVMLLAAASEAQRAHEVAAHVGGDAYVRTAVGWKLGEVAALLQQAGLFIGNDSGMLNLRVALGGVGYGLFGVSGPLIHSSRFVPIVSAAGARAGMESIGVEDVVRVLDAHGWMAH